MFAAKNISVQIGAKKLLDDVSLDVRPGEVVALLGQTGRGNRRCSKVCAAI